MQEDTRRVSGVGRIHVLGARFDSKMARWHGLGARLTPKVARWHRSDARLTPKVARWHGLDARLDSKMAGLKMKRVHSSTLHSAKPSIGFRINIAKSEHACSKCEDRK